MKVSELRTRIDDLSDLATLPGVTAELMSILQSKSIPVDYIGAVIQTDPALTAEVLRAANSWLKEGGSEALTIAEALDWLGEGELKSTLFHFTAYSKLMKFTPEQEQWMHEFWIHSAACAYVSRMLSSRFGIDTGSEDFIAGLLHDVGRLFLLEYLPDVAGQIQQAVMQKSMNETDAEIKLLGATHAAIGGWIAEKWNLPAPYRQTIAYHHDPKKAGEYSVLAALVNFSEACCIKLGYGFMEKPHDISIDHSKGWSVLESAYPGLRTMDEAGLLAELRSELKNQSGFTTLAQSSYLFTQMVADHTRKVDDIRNKIDGLTDLGTIPPIVTSLLAAVGNRDLSLRQMSAILDSDTAIAAKVLRVVNSPFYDFHEKIHTTQQAAAFLGLTEFSNLVLGIAFLTKLYSDKSWVVQNLDDYWEHAAACAIVARSLASRLGVPTGGIEFSAGLLHDLGKLVLIENFPEIALKITEHMQKEQCTDVQAEMAIIGVPHTEIGGWIADRWKLPPMYTEVIRFHSVPSQSQQYPILVSLIRIADTIVQMSGIGLSEGPVGMSLRTDEGWRMLVREYPFARDVDPDQMASELQFSIDDARGFLMSATSHEVKLG